MNKTFVATPAGENLTRYTVRLESEDCEKGTQPARFLQFEMLQTIAHNPANSQCVMMERGGSSRWKQL